jgi:hypothetical protein
MPERVHTANRQLDGLTDRWQLTQATLLCLLHALDTQESLAVERYQRLHERLTFFFMRHRCFHPEELADTVINRLARKLADGETISNIEAYALGVARMVEREDRTKSIREQMSYAELQRNGLNAEATTIDKEIALDKMEKQFAALPESSQRMLSQYHHGRGLARIRQRQKIADDLGISITTLRKRVFDLQNRLRLDLKRLSLEADTVHSQEETDHR